MTAPRSTSRFFAAWRALHADLSDAPWPSHPTTGAEPKVSFADRGTDADTIILPGRPARPSQAEWKTIGGAGRTEIFRLAIAIWCDAPNQTSADAVDRVEALADVVQATLRDPISGLPDGSRLKRLQPGLQLWSVVDLAADVTALPEGFGGSCAIEVQFQFRI